MVAAKTFGSGRPLVCSQPEAEEFTLQEFESVISSFFSFFFFFSLPFSTSLLCSISKRNIP